jgi:hypothetical protein
MAIIDVQIPVMNGRVCGEWKNGGAALAIPYPAAIMTAGILLYEKEARSPAHELHTSLSHQAAYVLANATGMVLACGMHPQFAGLANSTGPKARSQVTQTAIGQLGVQRCSDHRDLRRMP